MSDKFNFLKRLMPKAGTKDDDASTYWTTPWAYRDAGGLYVGHNREVWLYRQLTVHPMRWEDPHTRMDLGSPLATLLYELGDTSKDLGVGMRMLSKSREIHILSITWEEEATPPEGTPEGLHDFLDATLQFVVPVKAVVVGVKLWSSNTAAAKSVMAQLKNMTNNVMQEAGPAIDQYDADRKLVSEILKRNGAGKVPDPAVTSQMESWYNFGKGPDVLIHATKDLIFVDDADRIEMAAVRAFDNPMLEAPYAEWALEAQTHHAPASVVSIRGMIEPASISRNRVRRSQRKVLNQIEEERATGELERPEQAMTFQLAQEVERFILTGREPLISNCSIIMARRVGPDEPDTYIDELRNSYNIDVTPLVYRQIEALDETLPTSSKRASPFLQDVSVGMLAYAGLQGFSALGDSTGVFTGVVDPDFTPCYLNPLEAPARDMPPGMLIAGDSGSGKTFFAQLLALQASLAGLQTIFINPKFDSTIAGLAHIAGGDVVRLSDVETEPGYFDPFRFVPNDARGRSVAADIAIAHILGVLGSRGVTGSGLTMEEEITLQAGIRAGAEAGVNCVGEAIQFIEDERVKQLIHKQSSDPLFRLGIAPTPRTYENSRRLQLIEFDRPLAIPEKGDSPSTYSLQQRIALSAVRLVTQTSLVTLANANGGVLVLDEAWMFLGSSEGLAFIQGLGRLGRSKNILPIFATQRVDDLIKEGIDMESHLSRVFVMKLTDATDAKAAFELLGLEATPQRVNWLANAGVRRGDNKEILRPSMAIHRDLHGRRAAVMITPVPASAAEAFSTNPEELAKRQPKQ